VSLQAIRGFKDILPAEAPLWRRVEETARGILRSFGYEELRIPVLERTELFARGIGEDTDIVEKEMYTFPDRKGQNLTLRPEATAGIVRSVIEHGLHGSGQALKVYFIGPMFRYERPQKGRQRQFHQLDVEALGDPSAHMDAEIITLLGHFLKTLGLGGVTMNVNSLGCPVCRPTYKEELLRYLEARRDGFCSDCQRRMVNNPLRVLDCKVPECSALAEGAPKIGGRLCPDCRTHFDLVQADLAAAGVDYMVNPKLVRGLDYYSRTTFEALTGDLGAQNAVAGGGRYDGLAQIVGGPSIPATGWALGLERLVMLLAAKGEHAAERPDLFVAALGGAAPVVFGLIQDLRRAGLWVETDWAGGSLKSQLRRADRLGARRVLVLGPDELARSAGMLKDMDTKEQTDVALDRAVDLLFSHIKGDGR
jgi:histidyl-tRNA synthetase